MRVRLQELEEVRDCFSGTFVRKGMKSGYKGMVETVLLRDIKDSDGEILTDHLWFNYTKGFKSLGALKEGDVIQFNARVKQYVKGYQGYRYDIYKPIEIDYKLSHPSKIRKIGSVEQRKPELLSS